METLGTRLRRIRIDREMTLQELAWEVDVDMRTIRSWEIDHSVINIKNAIKVAKALNVSLDILACIEEFIPYHDSSKPTYSTIEATKRAYISTSTIYLLVEKELLKPLMISGKMRFDDEQIEIMKQYMQSGRTERKAMIYHAKHRE